MVEHFKKNNFTEENSEVFNKKFYYNYYLILKAIFGALYTESNKTVIIKKKIIIF